MVPGANVSKRRDWLISACCDAPVVGMLDVTVHPRLYVDGDKAVDGPLMDTLLEIRHQAEEFGSYHAEAYCSECGEWVDVEAMVAERAANSHSQGVQS